MAFPTMARSLLLLLAMVAFAAADLPSGVGPAVHATPSTSASSTVSSATKTSSTVAATHTVKVGPRSDPHKYVPHHLIASPGDTVVFEFYPRNHSVVQADFMAPCVPKAEKPYFYSGKFDSYSESEINSGVLERPPPTWSLKINDTEPKFFYCTAIDSCDVNGMVGVINSNSTMTWQDQYEKAKGSLQLAPDEPWPAEGHENDSSGSSDSDSSRSNNSSSTHLSGGAISGIVVGGVAFVAILVTLFFVLGRNRVYKKWMSSQDGRAERTARWAFSNNPPSGPAESVRKSEYDIGFQPMTADHSGMYVSSPDMAHAAVAPPYPDARQGSPPPQRSMPVAGHWSWDLTAHQQQQQYPPPPPPPPVELDSDSRK